MQEHHATSPEGAEDFRFPVAETPEVSEKKQQMLVDNLATQAGKFIAEGLAGKTLQGGTRVLKEKMGGPARHYTNPNAIWTTMVGHEKGGIRSISDLSSTIEGRALVEQFLEENNITDKKIIAEVVKKIKKIT